KERRGMFWQTKSVSPSTKTTQNSLEAIGDGQVIVSWFDPQDRRPLRRAFGVGRHLIGSSPFAAIRLGDQGHDICAALIVTASEARLKCLGAAPVLFVEGRKLQPGDSI